MGWVVGGQMFIILVLIGALVNNSQPPRAG